MSDHNNFHFESLKQLNDTVQETFMSEQSPPFLGLIEISDENQNRAKNAILTLGKGQEEIVWWILIRYPFFTSWYVCNSVRKEYGQDGTVKVWPIIAEALGVRNNLSNRFKYYLHNLVAKNCISIGLPIPEQNKISLFQLHAGVSNPQLPHLIRAFLALEKYYGLPELDDGNATNVWEDAALELVPQGLRVLRLPIEWDIASWHATVFVECRKEPNQNNGNYHKRFKNIINDIQNDSRRSYSKSIKTVLPKLVIENIQLALKVPEGTSRQLVTYDDGPELRIRSGKIVTLPTPLPHKIMFHNINHPIMIMPNSGCACIGDADLEGEVVQVQSKSSLSMSNVVIFARSIIQRADGNNLDCIEIADDLYTAVTELPQSEPLELLVGGKPLSLTKKSYRRISMKDGVIGRGKSGALYSKQSILHIATGIKEQTKRIVSAKLEESSEKYFEVMTDDFGEAHLELTEILDAFEDFKTHGPKILRAELMTPQSEKSSPLVRSGVRMRAYIWPEFTGLKDVELCCTVPPKNLVLSESRNIIENRRGNPCIDDKATSDAEIVFSIEDKQIGFTLPPLELSLEQIFPDGTSRPLPLGSQLILNHETVGGAVRISSHDNEAELQIPGKKGFKPFRKGRKYTVPLRGLDSGKIILNRQNGIFSTLVELQKELVFREVDFRLKEGQTKIALLFSGDFDALRVKLETEYDPDDHPECGDGDVYFGADGYLMKPPEWLSADKNPFGGKVDITVKLDGLIKGDCLGSIYVNNKSGWCPVVSEDGEQLTFIVFNSETEPENIQTSLRTNRIIKWLERRHSKESWEKGEIKLLGEKKSRLIKQLEMQSGGSAEIIRLSLSDEWYQSGNTWIPSMNALYDCSTMFEGSITKFLDAGPAFELIARLETQRLRDLPFIDTVALMGFKNAIEANSSGKKLIGFSIDRLMEVLQNQEKLAYKSYDSKKVLGSSHWQLSHRFLQDRIDQTDFFREDNLKDYEKRSINLRKIQAKILRPRKPIPIPVFLDESQTILHQDFTDSLRSFAVAARTEGTSEWVDTMSTRSELSSSKVLGAVGDMIRLAPELFAFHLLVAELEMRDQ